MTDLFTQGVTIAATPFAALRGAQFAWHSTAAPSRSCRRFEPRRPSLAQVQLGDAQTAAPALPLLTFPSHKTVRGHKDRWARRVLRNSRLLRCYLFMKLVVLMARIISTQCKLFLDFQVSIYLLFDEKHVSNLSSIAFTSNKKSASEKPSCVTLSTCKYTTYDP